MEDQYKVSLNKRYCLSALSLGLKYYSQVFPNPPVGALLVKDGKIIARGAHQKAGSAHAEVNAIKSAGPQAKGADLYVSLEPCNHFGKTPPCTKLILEAGIKRVYYLIEDATKASRGADYLRAQGVEVHRIEPSEQIKTYLEPWKLYALDGMISATPILFLDLAGSFATFSCSEVEKKILKRSQKIVDAKTDLSELNYYDVSFLIRDRKDFDDFLNIKSHERVKVNRIIIVRTMQYLENTSGKVPDPVFDTFGTLHLHQVQLFKEICLEEYNLTHV